MLRRKASTVNAIDPAIFCDAIQKGSRTCLSKAMSDAKKKGTFSIDMEINQEKHTILHQCVITGQLPLVVYILKKKPNVNAIDNNKMTPLHYACDSGNLEIIDELLPHTNLALKSSNGTTAFHLLCHKPIQFSKPTKFNRIFATFIQKGTDINSQNVLGETPLHLAVRKGNDRIVGLLLEANANPNLQNKLVSSLRSIRRTQFLLITPIPLIIYHQYISNGETCLHIAVKTGILKLVQRIVEKKADLQISSNEGTPLSIARGMNKQQIAEYLQSKFSPSL